MAKVLFAWELGGELGHALACASLASALHARGHRVALALRELSALAVVPEAFAWDVFQAPRPLRDEVLTQPPASFPEILLSNGHRDPQLLAQLLGAWRALFARYRPDLVVADFAPTALLAARTLGVPRASFGNGFFQPPRTTPLPSFRFDEAVDPARIAAAEAQALANANGALARFGAAPLGALRDALETGEDFLCTLPELDHYGTRERSGYWGPRARLDRGQEVPWPPGNGPRVFAYLKRTMPRLDALLDALAASGCRLVLFVPELDEARRKRLDARHRALAQSPVRLDGLLRECDLAVGHGGELAATALLQGVPQLLVPLQYEQHITATRIALLGAAVTVAAGATAAQTAAALERALSDAQLKRAARAFAARYPAYSPVEQRRRIVRRIEEMLAPASLPAP